MRTERVLITGARAPVALHLARLLHGAGCFVALADSLRQSVSFASKACDARVILPPINDNRENLGQALAEAIATHGITHVAPTCEEVFCLADLWAHRDMGACLLAPDLGLLATFHNKFQFVERVRAMGLPAPKTRLLQTADDVAACRQDANNLVFKPVWSRFGTEVQVCPGKLDIAPTPRRPWVAQDFVSGELCCAYAVATDGRLTALAAYTPRYRVGNGAGTAFAPLRDPEIAEFVRSFVADTCWTGQVSFDFIRDGQALWAIECNPRATSGLHLFDDPDSFATAFFGGAEAKANAQGLHGVKLAMGLYGALPAIRSGALHQYLRDLRRVTDVMVWPGDRAPRRQQWRAVAEITGIALRKRISLQAASTADIAWNGPG